MQLSDNSLYAFGCLLAGGASVLAFAPFGFAWVAPLTLAVLFWSWSKASPTVAAWYGFLFGTALFLAGTSWVYNSLSVYGGMPLWMGSIAVIGFAALLGSFYAVGGYLLAWLATGSTRRFWVLVSCAWVVIEWSKSWVLTGFPWLDFGYSQVDTALSGWAAMGGIYLVGWMLSLAALGLVAVVYFGLQAQFLKAITVMVMLGVGYGASLAIQSIDWGEDAGEPLVVGLVQPNSDINQKWMPKTRDTIAQRLNEVTQQLVQAHGAELVVWPETALPMVLSPSAKAFLEYVRPEGVTLITGIIEQRSSHSGRAMYNAAVIACDAETTLYRKQHLVPFGEYLPLRWAFQWVLDYLDLPMSTLSQWPTQQDIACGAAAPIGVTICYEDAYAELSRQNSLGTQLMVNISEDAWFGDSIAPDQRLQMARMRAMEVALPLVRSGNTGPSAVIDHQGAVLAVTPKFSASQLVATVQPRTGLTPFQRWGQWCVWLALSGLLVALATKLTSRLRSR